MSGYEGRDLPQASGVVSSAHLDSVASTQLIAGQSYGCQVCGKTKVAPDVYRCICGLRVCNDCSGEHEAG